MKGKFITFEGCEGVGKSTQLNKLKKFLESNNYDCIFIREPGGVKISENIRNVIISTDNNGMTSKCEALLYSASRAQLVEEVIAPALEQGKIVVCDRFIDSSFAYQGEARGLGFQLVQTLNDIACGDIVPNLTIFFDLSPQKGFLRKGGACQDDRLEQESIDFHTKVYDGYKKASQLFKDRIVEINADRDALSIFEDVIATLKDREIIK